MTRRLQFAPVFAAIIFSCSSLAATTRESSGSIAERFDSFVAIQQAQQDLRAKSVATSAKAAFDERFSEFDSAEKLRPLDGDELELVFRATRLVAFYTMSPEQVAKLELVTSALESRGLAKQIHYSQLYGAYVSIRRFDLAGELSKQHPDVRLEALPEYVQKPGLSEATRTWLSISTETDKLTREAVADSGADQLIVVAHPLCHFSAQAIVDIASDPLLSDLFRKHAQWLVPPGTYLDFAAVQQWRLDYPEQSLHLAYQASDWPEIDYWGTPTFYFLKNGAVVKKVVGWPPDGGKEAILAGFSSAVLRDSRH